MFTLFIYLFIINLWIVSLVIEPTQFSCKAEKNKGLFILNPKPGELKRFPEDPKGYAFQICAHEPCVSLGEFRSRQVDRQPHCPECA